jgi:hypothetical protein
MLMNILRRFGLSLAVLFFSLSISAFIVLISLHSVIDTPQPLEKALSTSGIYTDLVQSIVTQQTSNSSSTIASDPNVQKALEQSLSPTFLQDSSEKIINNAYGWAQGSVATPNLTIDLSQVKTNFANNIAAYAQQRLNALPSCTGMMMAPPTATDEILSLSCLPRGISPTSLANAVHQAALSSDLFPSGNTININDIKNPQGQTLTDQLSLVPTVHRYYTYALYAVPLLIVLLALAVIFLSSTRRSGIKRISWPLITTGTTSVIVAVFSVWLLGEAIKGLNASASSASIQDKLITVLQTLVSEIRIWWMWLGAGYVVLGILLLIIVRVTRPKPVVTTPAALGDPQNNPQSPLPMTDSLALVQPSQQEEPRGPSAPPQQ